MAVTTIDHSQLGPVLTPHGHLHLDADADGPELASDLADRLREAFTRGAGHALLQLGAAEVDTVLPPALSYWRDFAGRFIAEVCMRPNAASAQAHAVVEPPSDAELHAIAAAVPPMTGAEYLTPVVLRSLWGELHTAFDVELLQSRASLQEFLQRKNPNWNLVGRVYFNLAENRRDDEAPFAFIATYTSGLTATTTQHLPLGRALVEYAGAAKRSRLLSLLLPVQRAAEQCAWLKMMVDNGEIFHPLRWTPAEAFHLLTDLPTLEAAGVIVRVPTTWRGRRPPRPQVSATVGAKPPSDLGADALLDFHMAVTLEGEPLTEKEIAALLSAGAGLHFIRGRWIELDADKLGRMLDQFREVERTAAEQGLPFAAAMRLVAGANVAARAASDDPARAEWTRIAAGPWLSKMLDHLRKPQTLARIDPGRALKATLRPYQQVGVRWLHFLTSLRLGACLADDMGLGKTMQVLALLLVRRAKRPSILVAPASLLANWAAEIVCFAPTLRCVIAHPSAMAREKLAAIDAHEVSDVQLVMTSYGTLLRAPQLVAIPWDLAILDEAQAIKNPGSRQTRLVKQLDAQVRIALTGTPVENRLGDLWSIFDFINPGLLGSARDFSAFSKQLAARPHNAYAPLRELVRPYILRRLKTDRSVIADLPDKTEVNAYCALSRMQAALYQRSVTELAAELSAAEGMKRKGVVLAFLTRFKQICNHPSQWLGDGKWMEADSGKFARLREIAEVIGDKQEKVLVFTQFREVTDPLARFLASVFGRSGLVLHGGTLVAKRQAIVRRFQEDERVPFFVLSLRAGGFGLNLTAASHVIHFDRWWNPAVENQATDRAFRIGQTKNVLVHKFICKGTVEEKIDQLIAAKRQLSHELIEGGADMLLTEMNDDELLKLVALDVRAASTE